MSSSTKEVHSKPFMRGSAEVENKDSTDSHLFFLNYIMRTYNEIPTDGKKERTGRFR